MAIGKGDLSNKAKKGWSWRFGMSDQPWENYEALLIVELEQQGLTHNIRRLEENEERKVKVNEIRSLMASADDAKIDEILAALKA